MAIIKCKMCGGDLVIEPGSNVAECEYCGSRQTVPTADNEKKLTLFAQANRLRSGCEFDKAAGIYESIVADFPEEAEAYWGLVLCKYGIEYVDDPATGKKIPTCHRSSFDSILEDSDFEQACENADVVAQKVYRGEAKEFEQIRKGILEVSSTEKPYDIFICYKETDEKGDRTLDSVLAQDLYTALTDKGYRVFFSRVTLRDKLGEAFEPYIFAALNSAKVMLAVGTCYEYYNAVWVKNEWSRYLKLMAADKSKHLIPCYKDLDPEDMPREFNHLQGADLGKMGAIQDILFNMEKYIPLKKQNVVQERVVVEAPAASGKIASLLQREEHYQELVSKLETAKTIEALGQLAEDFRKVGSYRDSAAHAKTCETGILNRRYDIATALMAQGKYEEAITAFTALNGHRDSTVQIQICNYSLAESLLADEKKGQAAIAFGKAGDYQDARQRCMELWNTVAQRDTISAGFWHTVGLKADGTVVAVGENDGGQCNVRGWKDVVAISAGGFHTVGLKADGTVVAVGSNYHGQCGVSDWRDIVAISAGGYHIVGLKADGTVVTVGDNGDGQCDVSSWKDVVAISAGCHHTVGLKADGTVVAVGYNEFGQCNDSGWKDIVAISAGTYHTVGLKANGTVVTVGDNDDGKCNVSGWKDIVAISAESCRTVGLKADGTVVALGTQLYGECDVSGWKDIVAISAGRDHTVGLKADGTVVAVGKNEDSYGDHVSQCDVNGWTDIKIPAKP